jgi:hypothetical protein
MSVARRNGLAGGLAAAALLVASHAAAQSVPAADSTAAAPPFCCGRPHFLVAAGEIVALQVVPWYFNRHVADDTTAALSFTSWGRNIRRGFEWDNNAFPTNMFMHPYHGNLFFNAARTSGYSYWQSLPFAFAGSMMWEMFGENNKAAINDWVATSVGGAAIGEALYRTSLMVWDNEATGFERTWREFAGFFLNPVGGFNRAARGELSRVGPNPADRMPEQSGAFLQAGVRSVEEGESGTMAEHWFFDVTLQYGDPFAEEVLRPFDAFQLSAQVNGSDKSSLGRLQVEGVLWGRSLRRSPGARHAVTLMQNFDYINNEAYETGGQRLSGALLSDYRLGDGLFLATKLQGSLLLLWGVSSDYAELIGRDYDFGPGSGLRMEAALNALRTEVVQISYDLLWQYTLNGVKGHNFIHLLWARASTPIWRNLGAGAEFRLQSRSSAYQDFPDVKRTVPEFRAFLKVYPRRAPYWASQF